MLFNDLQFLHIKRFSSAAENNHTAHTLNLRSSTEPQLVQMSTDANKVQKNTPADAHMCRQIKDFEVYQIGQEGL